MLFFSEGTRRDGTMVILGRWVQLRRRRSAVADCAVGTSDR